MSKILETFFKHWPKLFLPIFLVAGIAIAIGYLLPPQYESGASIWTEKPTFLDTNISVSGESTLADTQASSFSQLLQTTTFLEAVTEQIKKLNKDLPPKWDIPTLSKSYNIKANGENLIVIKSTATTPELARDQIQGLFEAFRSRYTQELQYQSTEAIQINEKRLSELQGRQDKIDKQITVYLASRPDLMANPPGATLDPELSKLRQQSYYFQTQIDGLQSRIDQIRQLNENGIQGQSKLLRMEDAPNLPIVKGNPRNTQMALFGGMGALAGIVLGIGFIALMAVSNNTFYRPKELGLLTGLPTYQVAYEKRKRTKAAKTKVAVTVPSPRKTEQPLQEVLK